MSTKRIFLFTSSYPYGTGENFIEDEVLIKPSENYSITIIPFRNFGNPRNIPSYIKIDSGLADAFKRNTIYALFSISWIIKLISLCKSSRKPNNLKQWRDAFKYIIGSQIIKQYIKKLELRDEDVLYSYWFNHIPTGLTEGVIKYHKNKKIKIITRAHRYDIYEEEGVFIPFRKETISLLDRIFCISNDGLHYLLNKYSPDNLSISRLGVWKPQVLPDNKSDSVIRFVSCSSIFPVKRVDLIYECIRAYASQYPESIIEWTHFGSGSGMGNIKALVKEAPANLSIKLQGFVPKKNIMDAYRKIPYDIFVNLSESEGIPVSIMEAISYGIPVIATAVGGTPEILCDGAGISIQNTPDIPFEFCNAVDIILRDKEKFSEAAFNTFERNFNAMHNYKNFYNQILNL